MIGILFESAIQLLIVAGAITVFVFWRRGQSALTGERALDEQRQRFARQQGWEYSSTVTTRRIRWNLRGQDAALGNWEMSFYHTRGMDSGYLPPVLSLAAATPVVTFPAALRVHRNALPKLRGIGSRTLRALGQRVSDADIRAADTELAKLLAEKAPVPASSGEGFVWLSADPSIAQSLAADRALNEALEALRLAMPTFYVYDSDGYRDRALRLQCGPDAGYRFEAMAPVVDPDVIAQVLEIPGVLARASGSADHVRTRVT